MHGAGITTIGIAQTTTVPVDSRGGSATSAVAERNNDDTPTTGPVDSRGASGASAVADCNYDYTPTAIKDDYWFLFPERHETAIHKEVRNQGIGITVIQINTIEDHEPYQQYLGLIKQHRVNLIIELPKLEEDGDMTQKLRKHLARLMKYSSHANKVYVIAPANNGYWRE